MMISIIIPVRTDPRITACLESLAKLLPVSNVTYEILLVDNNVTPQLQTLAEQYQVRYLYESTPGSYRARNMGMANARGDIFAFTDSDCTVAPDWLQQLVAALADETVSAVMGLARGDDNNRVACYEQRMYQANIDRFVHQKNLKRIDTRNVAMRRKLYQQIGGFNVNLLYGGDMEYGARAHQAGSIIHFAQAMIVYHHNPTHLPSLLRKRRRQNLGNMKLVTMYPTAFILMYFPQLLRYQPTVGIRLWYTVLQCYAAVTFWWPWPLSYSFFKVQNVVAIHLGQLDYIYDSTQG